MPQMKRSRALGATAAVVALGLAGIGVTNAYADGPWRSWGVYDAGTNHWLGTLNVYMLFYPDHSTLEFNQVRGTSSTAVTTITWSGDNAPRWEKRSGEISICNAYPCRYATFFGDTYHKDVIVR